MTPPWYPGTRLTLDITTRDETADPPVLADPTTMVVTYGRTQPTAPDPVIKTFPDDVEIVHDGVGLFHIDIDCPDPGNWAVNVRPSEGLVGDGQLAWRITRSLIG